MKRGVGMQ